MNECNGILTNIQAIASKLEMRLFFFFFFSLCFLRGQESYELKGGQRLKLDLSKISTQHPTFNFPEYNIQLPPSICSILVMFKI